MGQTFQSCTCMQDNKQNLTLSLNRADRRQTSLNLMETIQTKGKSDRNLRKMNKLSKIFTTENDLSAVKIQKVFRGYYYRSNIFPEYKDKLIEEEKEYLTEINNKFITPEIKSTEKLFELKSTNPNIKNFLKEIDCEGFKFSKIKTADKTNSNYQKPKILVKSYNCINSYYQGQVNDFNEPHGEGTLYNELGCKYDGIFFNGEFTGYGRYIDSLGSCYEGNFIGGLLNGKGVKIISADNFYIGNFKNGLYEGTGREETIEFIYEGDFEGDKKSGKGKIFFKESKDTYKGDFFDDNIIGIGTYVWKNGHTYTGNFLNGKMNGKGVYKWKDGSIYEGDYVEGIREGKGKFTFKDGKIFIGNFKKGNPDGKGKYILKGISVDVEYINGKMIGNLKDCFLKKVSEQKLIKDIGNP